MTACRDMRRSQGFYIPIIAHPTRPSRSAPSAPASAPREPRGSPATKAPMPSKPASTPETFPNPHPDRDYRVHLDIPEFTCLCPLTGQPDFARFRIDYIPDKRNVELKSLKQYMWSFRNQGAFHEDVTNRILNELVAALAPRFMRVHAQWYVRGGIFTTVVVEHRKRGWRPAARVELDSIEPGPSTTPG